MFTPLAIDILRIGAVFLLVLANAFFVAAEFSLVSVRRTRIAELVGQGDAAAKAVQKALQNPDRVIAATQLGITISSIGLGWLGEPALAHLLHPVVALFPLGIQSGVSHSISAAIAFTLITCLHVVAGELAPKSIALQDPERTSLVVAAPTLWVETLFKPAIWALNGLGNGLLRLLGIRPAAGHQLAHSVEELKMLVTASAEGGIVEDEEKEMLHAVFDFGELVARQVMIPRTEVVAVEAEKNLDEIIAMINESTFTKFPVYEENLDQVIGIVHVKDLLIALQSAGREKRTARSLMREALFVPETTPVNTLLRQFRDHHQHIAIAVDEFGGTAGLVTLEDLLEEIVGEVSDPFDEATPGFQSLPDGSVLIDGLVLIEEVNEKLGLELFDPNYDTIAGYILGKLGRIPRLQDDIEADGVSLRVEEMDGLRIASVRLQVLDPDKQDASGPGQP